MFCHAASEFLPNAAFSGTLAGGHRATLRHAATFSALSFSSFSEDQHSDARWKLVALVLGAPAVSGGS